jgi:hypothetical protein
MGASRRGGSMVRFLTRSGLYTEKISFYERTAGFFGKKTKKINETTLIRQQIS